MVLCCNCLGQQNFECAMDFMDRVLDKVPACVIEEHPWVSALRPLYDNHLKGILPPSHDIKVQCCIACSLSITIPEGVSSSLRPIQALLAIGGDNDTNISNVMMNDDDVHHHHHHDYHLDYHSIVHLHRHNLDHHQVHFQLE